MAPQQLSPAGHALPQAPQLLLSAWRLASQPLAGLPSQSAKPGKQVTIWHFPPVHIGIPLFAEQAFPQAPQLLRSFWILVSQVAVRYPLQLAKPALQVPTVHWPPKQMPVPFGTGGQTFPQAPQLFTSLPRLVQVPLQAVCPAGQVVWHAPFEHCMPPGHALPHAPQLLESVCRFVSQPFAGLPSQLPKPALQTMRQLPPLHEAVPLVEEHAVPQDPQ